MESGLANRKQKARVEAKCHLQKGQSMVGYTLCLGNGGQSLPAVSDFDQEWVNRIQRGKERPTARPAVVKALAEVSARQACTMPWDESHPRVFEVQKASHRLSSSVFRSGCYNRAITILQNESGDYAGRDATAASLYRLFTNANRKLASQTSAAPSNAGQREVTPSQNQNPSIKEKQKQDKLQVKVIKEQLRRERQKQRHEQNKQLWQRRHEEKVRLRQQDLAARVRQQEEARNEQLHKLKQQQQKLEQQLEEHKQSSAELICADPVSVVSDVSAAPQKRLLEVQQFKTKAEVQLALVRSTC